MPFGPVARTQPARATPFDNQSNSFVSTNTQAAIEEARDTGINTISYHEIIATANTTVSTGTDTLMNAMTYTPAAGTYIVLFNTDIDIPTAGSVVSLSYYLSGSQVTGSLRKTSHFDGGALSAGNARAVASLQAVVSVNGSQAVEVRWSRSSGTITAHARSMIFIRVL